MDGKYYGLLVQLTQQLILKAAKLLAVEGFWTQAGSGWSGLFGLMVLVVLDTYSLVGLTALVGKTG